MKLRRIRSLDWTFKKRDLHVFFSVIGELRFEILPAVPGKLSIAVNHTGNPTSHTIWLEGRNLCDLRVERPTSTRSSKSEWIYIFDWAYYCLCCKMPRLWMDLVETSEQTLLSMSRAPFVRTWESQWMLLSTYGGPGYERMTWIWMLYASREVWGMWCRGGLFIFIGLTGWMQPLNLQLLNVWEQQSSYAFMASSLYEQCVGAVGMMHMCCIAVSTWRQSFSDLQLDGCKGQVDISDGQ